MTTNRMPTSAGVIRRSHLIDDVRAHRESWGLLLTNGLPHVVLAWDGVQDVPCAYAIARPPKPDDIESVVRNFREATAVLPITHAIGGTAWVEVHVRTVEANEVNTYDAEPRYDPASQHGLIIADVHDVATLTLCEYGIDDVGAITWGETSQLTSDGLGHAVEDQWMVAAMRGALAFRFDTDDERVAMTLAVALAGVVMFGDALPDVPGRRRDDDATA